MTTGLGAEYNATFQDFFFFDKTLQDEKKCKHACKKINKNKPSQAAGPLLLS